MEVIKKQTILLIDKPKGITSFDVIRRLRTKLGIRKMGHAGTLDPHASGLMIIGVEQGTKELATLIKLQKVYQAEILFGKKTDSGDITGKVIEEVPVSVEMITKEKLQTVLDGIVGVIKLKVPIYSAIKVKGQRLYDIARKAEAKGLETTDVELPEKEMQVFWTKLHGIESFENYVVVKVELEVASGTYIRSIAEEIGSRLGVPATLKELRRTKVGQFKIEDAQQC